MENGPFIDYKHDNLPLLKMMIFHGKPLYRYRLMGFIAGPKYQLCLSVLTLFMEQPIKMIINKSLLFRVQILMVA